MRIHSLVLREFPPFSKTTIVFPAKSDSSEVAEVQLLTGQNGTGKTRLLCLALAACGSPGDLQRRTAGNPVDCYVVAKGSRISVFDPKQKLAYWQKTDDVDSVAAKLLQRGEPQETASATTKNFIDGQTSEPPFGVIAYRASARLDDAEIKPFVAEKEKEARPHTSFIREDQKEDAYLSKAVFDLKVEGAMNSVAIDEPSQAKKNIVDRLERVISKITGNGFDFAIQRRPKPALKARWNGLVMTFAQMPDGLRSIVGWLVGIAVRLEAQFPHSEDPLNEKAIILLDEPENHLHPAWQRKLIPAAQAMLPNAQMIIATHSPFIISSVNEGFVHILKMGNSNVVSVNRAEPCSKGDSFIDVVDQILGVKDWYDPETEALVATFRSGREKLKANPSKELAKEVWLIASQIRDRSESLRVMMANEISQLARQLKQIGFEVDAG